MRRQLTCLALLALTKVACSAAGQGHGPGGGNGAAPGSGGSLSLGAGASGGSLSLGEGAMSSGATGPNSDLPPPWQYFSDDTTFAFKDETLGDDVRAQFPETENATGAPTLLYPLAGSMHPMNLGDIVF